MTLDKKCSPKKSQMIWWVMWIFPEMLLNCQDNGSKVKIYYCLECLFVGSDFVTRILCFTSPKKKIKFIVTTLTVCWFNGELDTKGCLRLDKTMFYEKSWYHLKKLSFLLHVKLGDMKKFVKPLSKDRECFKCLSKKRQTEIWNLSEAKLKEGVF